MNNRVIKKLIVLLLTVLFAFCFIGCSVEERYEYEVIPDAMGRHEGLWLYKGNMRSRTDGSESDTILKKVDIDGNEYEPEQFLIVTQKYLTDICQIIYIIELPDESRYIYHYDYKNKLHGKLYDLQEGDDTEKYTIEESDYYVYVRSDYSGVLFTRDLEFVFDKILGSLDGDLLYRYSGRSLEWYYHGKHLYNDDFPECDYAMPLWYCGNYCYFLGTETPYSVNLETAVGRELVELEDNSKYLRYCERYYYNGSVYLLTVYNAATEGSMEDGVYKLFKVTGDKVTLEYNFGNPYLGDRVDMRVYKNMLYFSVPKGNILNKHYAYNMDSGVIVSVLRSKGKVIEYPSSSNEESYYSVKNEPKTVNGYTFYVESQGYDKELDMFGSHYSKTCYYLMRKHGRKEEVMQYSLNQNRGYFFDDICEF